MAAYFLEILDQEAVLLSGGVPERFWRKDGTSLKVITGGVPDIPVAPNQDGLAELRRNFPHSQFHPLTRSAGEFYPRMARPNSCQGGESPGRNPDPDQTGILRRSRAISTGQLYALITQLQSICQTIHPETQNLQTFGNEIRNLLILTCTEVEAQWKNVLSANGYSDNGNLKTSDYVKLLSAMRLAEFEVAITWYPWLATIKPFSDWQVTRPTKSLDWYDAYNKVKHDRDRFFHEATLFRVIYATTGCFVMLCAQYGWEFARRGVDAESVFFKLINGPSWHPTELYVPADGSGFRPINYPFS